MQRFVCLEIRVACGSCGQSIPVNGPFNRVTCSACFREMPVSEGIIGDFLNDFEEEQEGLSEGQGQGGTVISGSGTFKYGYWKLRPRCSGCGKPLEIPEDLRTGVIRCNGCAEEHHFFPAPEWLRKEVPSAVSCMTPEPPPGRDGRETLVMDENASSPIVMSCPRCAGALTVSSKSERIMNCGYCSSEVYVPDQVWQRLHPVRLPLGWSVVLAGKTRKQLQAERRRLDEAEEEKDLKAWKIRNAPGKARRSVRKFMPIIWSVLALSVAITVLGQVRGNDGGGVAGAWSALGPYLIVPFAVLVPVWLVVRSTLSSKMGRGRESKRALADLAARHGWKHEGAEYNSIQGSIDTKYRGRDIEIRPDDDYAIEVEVQEGYCYLKTEPPGYPGEEVRRFTTGDPEFDEVFPIRYAEPEFAERIESSEDEARAVLAPVYWFLGRWRGRLGRMKVDRWEAGVHLAPGHEEIMETGMYVMPEDLEPLLEDMMLLAAGLDAVASGREPELP